MQRKASMCNSVKTGATWWWDYSFDFPVQKKSSVSYGKTLQIRFISVLVTLDKLWETAHNKWGKIF